MQIVDLILHYTTKRQVRMQIAEPPESQDIREIKIQVGKMIKRVKKKAAYYYLVVAVAKTDGTRGYRTIIPKTIVE